MAASFFFLASRSPAAFTSLLPQYPRLGKGRVSPAAASSAGKKGAQAGPWGSEQGLLRSPTPTRPCRLPGRFLACAEGLLNPEQPGRVWPLAPVASSALGG